MTTEAPAAAPARPPRLPLSRRLADLLGRLLIAATAVSGAIALYWYAKHAIAIQRLTRGVGDTMFLSADGRPWFRLDERRYDVPLAEVSPHLRHAVIAVEDQRFYKHPGIDPIALARAAVHDIRELRVAEGGSTITQQLARTLFLSNRKSLARKGKEAVLAVMLEQALSKDQILELYLNRVYLSGGVYGVGAMSRDLFVKRAKDLNPAEAALVAGVIQAPSALSPWSNYPAALARSHVVLALMREQGYLGPAAEQQARRARPKITGRPTRTTASGGYAKEYLRLLFRELASDDDPPDWRVRTSFVPALQLLAEQSLERGLGSLRRQGLQGALVAIDAHTADLLALVGGAGFAASPFNRAVRSRRQPGSAFKPFVFAAALERGLSPVSQLRGLQLMEAAGHDEWEPHNSSEGGPDVVTLREALLTSNNRAAVALQRQLGSRAVLQVAARVGLHDMPDVPSLALGTGLVTPLELTTAFAVFPNGGWALKPRAILEIQDADGDVAYADASMKERALQAPAAFQALSMLRDVAERGTGSAARTLGFPVGGKTGTTDDFKDAWFVGFTADTVVGVWVGFDQPATIASNGYAARVALPIWIDFMSRAARLRRPQEFAVPDGLREIDFCQITYRRAVAECPAYVEYFKPGDDVPPGGCPLHRGDLKQRVGKALDGLWGRIKGIFR